MEINNSVIFVAAVIAIILLCLAVVKLYIGNQPVVYVINGNVDKLKDGMTNGMTVKNESFETNPGKEWLEGLGSMRPNIKMNQ